MLLAVLVLIAFPTSSARLATLGHDAASPSVRTSCCMRIRGGATIHRVSPSSRATPWMQVNSSEMSDAERIYVLQQFAQQSVRRRFLSRTYFIVFVQ